jgi:DNA polymerase III delta prime subunit
MPITFTYEKKDEHGNKYCVDEDGNRVEEENEEYRYLNREYVDYVNSLTEEQLAQQRAEGEARVLARQAEAERKAKPFLLKSLGNLKKPKVRKPLWLNATGDVTYWATRELCILAGDNGVGKSLVALQVARQLIMQNSECKMENGEEASTEGNPSPQQVLKQSRYLSGQDDVPNKVLYIDWELTEEDFAERFGEDVPENFFWAGFNMDGEMPKSVPDKVEWLLQNFTTTVKDTGATILIIDQPDRLHLSPQKWTEFLIKLKALMREYDLSVMLALSNKSRHTGRACGVNNIPKGNLLIPCSDSVIMVAQNQRRTCERYIKVVKNRNRPAAEDLELINVIEIEESEGYLSIKTWGQQAERDMLPPNAAERKNRLIMKAEMLWNEGLSCLEVGERMMVAESTIKSWLRTLINPSYLTPGPSPKGEGRNPYYESYPDMEIPHLVREDINGINAQKTLQQQAKQPVVKVSLPGMYKG